MKKRIALKKNGLYVTAEPNGEVTCNRTARGPWEIFEVDENTYSFIIEDNDAKTIALKSWTGFYLRAENAGGSAVDTKTARDLGPWELWLPSEPVSKTGDRVSFRAWDRRHFLTTVWGPWSRYIGAWSESPQFFDVEIVEEERASTNVEPWSGRVSATGTRLYKSGQLGQPWFLKGASFFRGYERFLRDEDLKPQLQQLANLGCNCVDVWSMYYYINVNNHGLPPFNMYQDRDRAYAKLKDFHELLAGYGIGSIWVGFCDPGIVLPGLGDQQAHWNLLIEALSSIDNCAVVILNNEHNAHTFNRVDREKFNKPHGHVSICSSWTDGLPPPPHWDGFGYHQPRNWPKIVKDACTVDHPGTAQHGKFVLLDEPDRIDSRRSGRLQEPRTMEMMALTAMGSAAGIVFHSQNGKLAELYDGYTMDRARAFFGALKQV